MFLHDAKGLVEVNVERGRMVFVTGGARSGKSAFAEDLARRSGKQVVYIATSPIVDEETRRRVEEHRRRRPDNWITAEETMDPHRVIHRYDDPGAFFLLDCLTLLVSNHLLATPPGRAEGEVIPYLQGLAKALRDCRGEAAVVSNEVGMGVVPERELGRIFRDLAGRANQIFAAAADEVYVMFAGLPMRLK